MNEDPALARPTLQPPRRGFEHVFRFVTSEGEIMAKIMPGEYYVTKPPEVVTTLLGSCVAACITIQTSNWAE